ncbi:MAG: TIGR02757 family protein [Melioribacteraceae bacterium]|nr:MAG: TIGR02757 family protein [Melioribacteraceae bacterium]
MGLKHKLDYHYRFFNASQISPDPLEFPHRFRDKNDIEVSAFISSIFAFGNIKQIITILEKVHSIMGESPYKFVMEYDNEKQGHLFDGVIHRFFTSDDIRALFRALNKIYVNYGSLKYFFLLYHFPKDKNLKDAIAFFSKNLTEFAVEDYKLTGGLKFMFPNPFKSSACKRMNLFLRWVVRNDELDFGLWKEIPPSKLVIPVDTHVAKICKELGLTTKKNLTWGMAEEITENLKEFDADDPIKYDFAICHIGMRKMKF